MSICNTAVSCNNVDINHASMFQWCKNKMCVEGWCRFMFWVFSWLCWQQQEVWGREMNKIRFPDFKEFIPGSSLCACVCAHVCAELSWECVWLNIVYNWTLPLANCIGDYFFFPQLSAVCFPLGFQMWCRNRMSLWDTYPFCTAVL